MSEHETGLGRLTELASEFEREFAKAQALAKRIADTAPDKRLKDSLASVKIVASSCRDTARSIRRMERIAAGSGRPVSAEWQARLVSGMSKFLRCNRMILSTIQHCVNRGANA